MDEYVLRVLSVSRGSVLRVHNCLYSKYFVFRYCGYIFACALGVPYCSHSQYSHSVVGPSQHSQYIEPPVLQYSQYSDHEEFSSIYRMKYLWYLYFTLSAKKHSFCRNVFWMCWILFTQSATKYYVSTSSSRNFSYLRLRCKHWIDRRESFVQGQYPLTGIPSFTLLIFSTLFPQTAVYSLSSNRCVVFY